jgi:aspartate carbamoyltransferase catalytic subunit
MKHIVESQQFDRKTLEQLFTIATELETHQDPALREKIMASVFYEPSTRTRFSFESAMLRLGGSIISTENATEFSSTAKGESLEDTIKVVANYVDVIVLRHFEEGAAKRATLVSAVPIINAGDGPGQHPTQALLDLYTIQRELGGVNNLTIAMIGDLKHGRTVRSLCYLLGKYNNMQIIFVSPAELKIGQDIKDYLDRHGVRFSETQDMNKVIGQVEVLYQTRIQKERFSSETEYQRHKGRYIILPEHARQMKPKSIIMHPLPRVDEIAPTVDEFPRAAYFRQTKYGLLVRMALLKYVLS